MEEYAVVNAARMPSSQLPNTHVLMEVCLHGSHTHMCNPTKRDSNGRSRSSNTQNNTMVGHNTSQVTMGE